MELISRVNAIIARRHVKEEMEKKVLKRMRAGIAPTKAEMWPVKPNRAFEAVCYSNRVELIPFVFRLGLTDISGGVRAAIARGNIELLKWIIEQCLPSKEEIASFTDIACEYGKTDIVQYLFTVTACSAETPPIVPCKASETAMECSDWIQPTFPVRTGRDTRKINYHRAFYYACGSYNLPLVNLLHRKIRASSSSMDIDYSMAEGEDRDAVERRGYVSYMEDRLDWREEEKTAAAGYAKAASKGRTRVLEYLGSIYHFFGDEGIMGACLGGRPSLVRRMLQKPVTDKKMVFECACRGGNPTIVDGLIEWGDWGTALSMACLHGHESLFNHVIRFAHPTDASDLITMTCRRKRFTLLRSLLQFNYSSLDGALIAACRFKDTFFLNSLLDIREPRVDPEVGMIPACFNRNREAIAALIAHGAKNIAKGLEALFASWNVFHGMILPASSGRIGCIPEERTMILPASAGRIGCIPEECTMIASSEESPKCMGKCWMALSAFGEYKRAIAGSADLRSKLACQSGQFRSELLAEIDWKRGLRATLPLTDGRAPWRMLLELSQTIEHLEDLHRFLRCYETLLIAL